MSDLALRQAWSALCDAAAAFPPRPGLMDHAVMVLLQQLQATTAADRQALAAQVGESAASASHHALPGIAMGAGALVEAGLDGRPLAAALTARIPAWLVAAREHATAAEALGAPAPDDEGAEGAWVGDAWTPGSWIAERLDSHTDALVAWHELGKVILPLIAATTRDRIALERFVAAPMPRALDTLRHLDPSARFLHTLHHILLDAPVRVIDVESRIELDVVIDAVATNLELHMLLLDAIADELGIERPPPDVIACLEGRGPQRCDTRSESVWAMYAGPALTPLRAGKKVPMKHWIWNEGLPADIPAIDGVRTLVLGPQTYPRKWDTGRTFAALGGRVRLVPGQAA